jgi:disulfide bond formation protein DsbB
MVDALKKICPFRTALLVSFVCVSGSYWLESWKNVIPCDFCLYQRWIWIFVLVFSLLGIFCKTSRWSHRIMGIALFAIISVSYYQHLIISGVLLSKCGTHAQVRSSSDFLAMMTNKSEPCSKLRSLPLGIPAHLSSGAMAFLVCGIFAAVDIRDRKKKDPAFPNLP